MAVGSKRRSGSRTTERNNRDSSGEGWARFSASNQLLTSPGLAGGHPLSPRQQHHPPGPGELSPSIYVARYTYAEDVDLCYLCRPSIPHQGLPAYVEDLEPLGDLPDANEVLQSLLLAKRQTRVKTLEAAPPGKPGAAANGGPNRQARRRSEGRVGLECASSLPPPPGDRLQAHGDCKGRRAFEAGSASIDIRRSDLGGPRLELHRCRPQ